jgi:uncharacterized OsmC-like protein
MTLSMVHRVSLTRQEAFRFTVAFDAAPAAAPLMLDEPAPLGHSEGPNAADLLAAAVGNCLAASLLLCLQKSHATVETISATVTAHTDRDDRGRLRIVGIDVDINPRLRADDAAKLERCRALFEDYCTVSSSVRQGIPINVRVLPATLDAVTAI